jgi:hypothetical protein
VGASRAVSVWRRSTAARTRRWVAAWLVAAALLAILLLANSVGDYIHVRRILAVQQVRHLMAEYVARLEQRLRQPAVPAMTTGEMLTPEAGPTLDDALWLELRRPDGSVLARRGNVVPGTFTAEEQSDHFRAHQPLFKVIPSPAGEAVVEVFPLYGTALGAPVDSRASSGAATGRVPRSLLAVEIAVPLVVRDPSILRPIRRNLVIACSGALALLVTVVVAGVAFRSHERREWLEAQLEIAREVQTALLPLRTDDVDPLRLAAAYRPAEQVSGDFYDAFRSPDGRVALVIGDVAGKGVPAALVAAVIHGAVRSATWTESGAQHERESRRLNHLLCGDAPGGRYASMFWGYYDPATSTLLYVNAGHLPPVLLTKCDHGTDLIPLDVGGPVLGVLGDAHYQQGRRQVRPGETLVLYSDGLAEAANPAGEEYGADRLHDLLRTRGDASPKELRDAILAALDGFVGSAVARDDLTLVVAGFGPSGQA